MERNQDQHVFDKCRELTTDSSWQNTREESDHFTLERSSTWAHFPNRYLLTEFGEEEKRLLRRNKVASKMFSLSVLSVARTDTRKRDYSRYFILPDDTIYHISLQVGEAGDPQTQSDITSEYDFAINNGFLAPNNEDLLQLDWVIKNAIDDGVEPYTVR